MYVNKETKEQFSAIPAQYEEVDGELVLIDNSADYVELQYDELPELGLSQYIIAGDIRVEDGVYTQGWVVETLPFTVVKEQYIRAVQQKFNDEANALHYDSINTAISYADEPAVEKFQKEGRAFRAWRSTVWAWAYTYLDEVVAGTKPQPTVPEFIAEMPALVLEDSQ